MIMIYALYIYISYIYIIYIYTYIHTQKSTQAYSFTLLECLLKHLHLKFHGSVCKLRFGTWIPDILHFKSQRLVLVAKVIRHSWLGGQTENPVVEESFH